MADTSSLSGVGSGIDTTSLISGLVSADSGRLNALKTKQTSTSSAISTLSDISSALGTLQNAVDALSTANGVGSYAGTSSSSAIAISTTGNALPGNYTMNVTQLARAQRTYSNTYSSASTAVGQSGTLAIQVGSGTAASINVAGTDTLDQIAAKINSSGARVSASVFYDGSNYRLQVSGLDTGKDNAITFSQTGLDLGLNVAANTVQKAQNSIVNIDGFDVQRSTNQVVGAIQGVTLALTATTTAPVDVSVAADSKGLAGKIQAMVTAYNSVLSKINTAAGKGSTPAANSTLASDSTLRSITNRLSTVLQTVSGTGKYNTLGSVGLSLQRDGTLALDTSKLDAAVSADPSAVSALFAGTSSTDTGVMGSLSSAIKTYNETGTGLLTQHQTDMQSRVTDMNDSITREQDRLDRYQTLLQKQFSQMDTTVTSNNNDMSYLTKLYSNSSSNG
ncbi:MAG: flagellar filament capping protein FliD [Pseudomonadota bacterium]